MLFWQLGHDHLPAEDLDKTLDAPSQRMPPKGDTSPEPSESQVHECFIALYHYLGTKSIYDMTSSVFRTILSALLCLNTVKPQHLSQVWETKVLCPLTVTAVSWCLVSAPLLQPLRMHPSAPTRRSWPPWSWICPRRVERGGGRISLAATHRKLLQLNP